MTFVQSCHRSKWAKKTSTEAVEIKWCESSTGNPNQWLLSGFYTSRSIWKAPENKLTALKGPTPSTKEQMSFGSIIQSRIRSRLRIQITAWHFRPSPTVTDQKDRAQTFYLTDHISTNSKVVFNSKFIKFHIDGGTQPSWKNFNLLHRLKELTKKRFILYTGLT